MTRLLIASIVAVATASTGAASNVFIGSSNFDPTETKDVVLELGESAELNIWWRPEQGQVVNGAGVDVQTSIPGILDATTNSVFNPTAGADGPRWNGTNDGDIEPADPNKLIEGMLGVSVNAAGIDYEDQFCFSCFDTTWADGHVVYSRFTVAATGVGSALISPAPNARNPITAEGQGAIDVDFAGIRVVVVPEPCAACLIGGVALTLPSLHRRVARRTGGLPT